jgi:GNAT superfamily N-acetyltransferase
LTPQVSRFFAKDKGAKKRPPCYAVYAGVMQLKAEFIMDIKIEINAGIKEAEVVELYRANKWSSANKPEQLLPALKNSRTLVTARISGRLVGIGNAISDGYLVVYYPHMLVHPDFQGRSIGRKMMEAMQTIYGSFHQQQLTADAEAIHFYKALGFKRAGKTEPMWIYAGNEH